MRRVQGNSGTFARRLYVGGLMLVGLALVPAAAGAAQFTLNVEDQDGTPISGFRYLVQEDCLHRVEPQAANPHPDGRLSTDLHRSHCHALQSGNAGGASTSILNLPDGQDFFVSVLPNDPAPGVQTGGKHVPAGAAQATVVVPNGAPFQTSQISYKVFYDGFGGPLNNAPDVGEPGIAGFSIIVEDAGGQVQQDAFGKPLGTTYQQNLDGTFILDGDGLPVVDVLGTGVIKSTCSTPTCTAPGDGEGVIKFLAPGKYGIITVPPQRTPGHAACSNAGIPIQSKPQCKNWVQTTTIEGTKIIDAWVAPGNGERLVEFGPAFWHTFYGWVPTDFDQTALIGADGTASISGTVRRGHLDPFPNLTFFPGPAFVAGQNGFCYVAVNTLFGSNQGAKVAACDGDGNFTVDGLAPGLYQVVTWDTFQHIIIDFRTVSIANDGDAVALGDVVVPMWFAQHDHHVFFDTNQNAVWDNGEPGMLEEPTGLRFRDGTTYQGFPTDGSGAAPYENVFPFFHWQVAEVGYTRFKPTGVTITNDLGAAVTGVEGADPIGDYGQGKRNPDTETKLSYPDPANPSVGGPILTQAFQNFAGQSLRFDWGKALWAPGENGGIAGIVYNGSTRAEDDPELYAAEPWEAGLPDVQVALYAGRRGRTGNVSIRNINGPGTGINEPDVDNYPLGFGDCTDANDDGVGDGCVAVGAGPEDIDRDGDGLFDYGDAVDVVWTDSWDANKPEGCPHGIDIDGVPGPDDFGDGAGIRCMDGLGNWNQIRDGVFDGGYAFGGGTYTNPSGNFPSDSSTGPTKQVRDNFDPSLDGHLPGGTYLVQVYAPKDGNGDDIYLVSRSQHKNVDFGPEFQPKAAAIPEAIAECMGGNYRVPASLTLFPGVDATLAGQLLKDCNIKAQEVAGSGEAALANNAVVDFFLHTEVPLAGQAIGISGDDFANEAAPGKPTFTEKFAPPFLPISWYDYTGEEFRRIYGDEFAAYNTLVPATVSMNLPTPSGISPMMHRFCLNHPGPIEDPSNPGVFITDPNFDARYSTTCYTFDFWPGKTTYLDTPVIRLAAFVGPQQAQTDCTNPSGTPVINRVITSDYNGPVLDNGGGGKTITIVAQGDTLVPNPFVRSGEIQRDFGFGTTEGTVSVGSYEFPAGDVTWSNGSITVTVPDPTVFSTGQLMVTRGDNGRASETGVTLHVGIDPGTVLVVNPGAGQPIQTAVDAANPGDLILVTQGVYDEAVIVYKEVKLQGAGGPSTVVFASPFSLGAGAVPTLPTESDKLQAWRNKLAELDGLNLLGFLPGQDHALTGQATPGFLVIPNPGEFALGDGFAAQIDGFGVQGSNLGGGVFVNAYADGLTISNNRVFSNLGSFAGGIRVGNPLIANLAIGGFQNIDPADMEGVNPNVTIAYNEIFQNSSNNVGGGIGIFTGADNYAVTENLICGNFSRRGGGGIAQQGRVGGLAESTTPNQDGLIQANTIIFNEVFQGDEVGGGGGGIELAGEAAAGFGTLLTEGTGSVTIDRNLIHGNLGGAAPGGGIAVKEVNGEDVASEPSAEGAWHEIEIFNNMVSNNAGGQWGAGIALSDAVQVQVVHNTIAHNDNAAVASNVRNPDGNTGDAQPSGLASTVHSAELAAVMGAQTAIGGARLSYAHPSELRNNIFDRNRSFDFDKGALPTQLVPDPAASVGLDADAITWDFGVVGFAACMNPEYSLVTNATGPDGCVYDGVNDNNVIRGGAANPPEFVNPLFLDLIAATAADEGGNDAQLLFTPITLVSDEATSTVYDYHIGAGSAAEGIAQGVGGIPELAVDFDQETRPAGSPDAGADEIGSGGPGGNIAPTAVDDTATTDEGVPVTIAVLGNDTDTEDGTPSVTQITVAPANGTAEINPDGTITYRPYGGFVGDETFTYEVDDSGGLTDTAVVTVTVNSTALLPETITIIRAIYKVEPDRWVIKGTTDLIPANGKVEVVLHRTGEMIPCRRALAEIDAEGNWLCKTGSGSGITGVAGDHVIIRTLPNNKTFDRNVGIRN